MPSHGRYDVVVLGAGVAGLTAALTSALGGARVLVVEKADVIGGTSARSSGTVWIPDNDLMRAAGMHGDGAAAEQYLSVLTGQHDADAMWRVFLGAARDMIADLGGRAGLAFRSYLTAPDYRQEVKGAALGGRPLEPLPFDGRVLGADFKRIAAPLRELTLFGGIMVTRGEAATLLKADRSISAAALGVRLVARYAADRLKYPRGTRLVLGNALVARLYHACVKRGVEVQASTSGHELIVREGSVCGVRYEEGGKTHTLDSSAVVLAGGGFPAGRQWREDQFPRPVPQYTPAAESADGSTIDLGLSAGGVLGPAGLDNALWFPSSLYARRDGSVAVYPHIVLDRAKPGIVAVDQTGDRFTNEASSYHDFVRAMYRADSTRPAIPAWLVCDRKALRRYGLGVIRPRTPFVGSYVSRGYVKAGATLAELADKMGVPVERLGATVARFNHFAEAGVDTDFHRGDNPYDQSNGDAAHKPNPCLGLLDTGPFFAVQLHPTPLGTSRGLRADRHARVLDGEGRPVAGLYVCGNDMQSPFNGEYPGAGAQLGQGMTFGWLAGCHVAARLNKSNQRGFHHD